MRSWDFERIVLLLLAVLILAGVGYTLYLNSQEETLQRQLPEAERKLKEMGDLVSEILQLKKEIKEDNIASGQVGPYQYIEQQAVESRIGKTRFNIAPPTEDKHESDGYMDMRYVLTPASSGAAAQGRNDFTRQEVANFLLYIEGNTTRMKVTRIRLDLAAKQAAGQKLGDETWKPTITITDRLTIVKS
ncbi:MAG: hypothetical protein ACT4PU_04085 [Planctomycetota bacterium]